MRPRSGSVTCSRSDPPTKCYAVVIMANTMMYLHSEETGGSIDDEVSLDPGQGYLVPNIGDIVETRDNSEAIVVKRKFAFDRQMNIANITIYCR
jgi:hypothetical protein